MSKVMLVEDDDSLREIYSIRLTAEGYNIVSAKDGEEALAIAVRERPDLIVSDVMMPKISGFDMLDILRSTPETQNIKVIMMTALSSEEERQRGERLGADRYLVKSQVGIEDVVNAVHEVLGDRAANGMINPATPVNDAAMPAVSPVFSIPNPNPTSSPSQMSSPALNPSPIPDPVPSSNPMPRPATNLKVEQTTAYGPGDQATPTMTPTGQGVAGLVGQGAFGQTVVPAQNVAGTTVGQSVAPAEFDPTKFRIPPAPAMQGAPAAPTAAPIANPEQFNIPGTA